MNKTALKNFAVWARNKLISDITYKAGLMGIAEDGIKEALPQSTKDTEFYNIGTKEPYSVSGDAVRQRKCLVDLINQKAASSDYTTACRSVIEEAAYTWFNRLIAIRFMEVNDYLPSRIRALSSGSTAKLEPDLVTTPFDTDLELTDYEKAEVIRLKNENQVDECFRLLFIKQCNALNAILPKLFEKTADYSELLLNVSVTDQDGVVYHLVHDIEEDDFNIEKGGQVEIIGWLYQYYNDERKNEVINIYKGFVKKDDIPAATQLFTTGWVVQYIVDNSLGRYWIERNSGSSLKTELAYLVKPKDGEIPSVNEKVLPEDLKVLDPCMGSGHFLVYAFEVLMRIYTECGYAERDAAKSILEHNIYGLDIDDRAFQIAYFAVMMKARQYNRRILNGKIDCHVYSIQESNTFNRAQLKYFGAGLSDLEKHDAQNQIIGLLNTFTDAKEYGSILNVGPCSWDLLRRFAAQNSEDGQMSLDSICLDATKGQLQLLIEIGQTMAQKYDVVVTNPPYLNKMDADLKQYVADHYKDYAGDLFSVFMYRNFGYCKTGGYSGFMTPFVWMFIKTYENLRKYIIDNKTIATLIQMEYSAFEEATVPVCSFVLINRQEKEKGLYFKLSDFKGGMEVQKQKVLEAINDPNCGYFFESEQDNFSKIPGSPVAYWVGENFIKAFDNSKISDCSVVTNGMFTCDNKRFLRLWQEVNINNIFFNCRSKEESKLSNKKWYPYNKGGDFRRWYGNHENIVNFEHFGEEISDYRVSSGQSASFPGQEYYFHESLSWSFVSSSKFGIRYYPSGFVFDIAGSSVFPNKNDDLFYLLAVLASEVSFSMLNLLNPTINFQAGDIKKVPAIIDETYKPKIITLVKQSIDISKTDWDSFETSWNFKGHPLVHGVYKLSADSALTIEASYKEWEKDCQDRFTQLKSNEGELNRIIIGIYGLQNELSPEVEDKDVTVRKADLQRDIKSLLSYAVGCMFGRYSLDIPGLAYAGGKWDDSKYISFIPDKDNILPITDEQYFQDDIVGLFCEWLKRVYGADTLEENLDFVAKALGNKGNTSQEVIRNYFLNEFFKDHCKTYQKRPIYWLFDSGKQNGFKSLIYMHRHDENTIGNLRIDYLHRMERVYESEIARMQDTVDNSTNAREVTAAAKRKEKLQKQVKECKEYDEKIAHLALARIKIDLDDGVKVNYEKVQTGTDSKKYPVLAKI